MMFNLYFKFDFDVGLPINTFFLKFLKTILMRKDPEKCWPRS